MRIYLGFLRRTSSLIPNWKGIPPRAAARCDAPYDRVGGFLTGLHLFRDRRNRLRIEPVRDKAIEIANALLEEGMKEGNAIRIAIAKAKNRAQRHGM